MNIRTFTIAGLAGLTVLSAAAGYTADHLDGVAEQLADAPQVDQQSQDCMADGFMTDAGMVGCFTPVIAIIDESFFETEDEAAEDVEGLE